MIINIEYPRRTVSIARSGFVMSSGLSLSLSDAPFDDVVYICIIGKKGVVSGHYTVPVDRLEDVRDAIDRLIAFRDEKMGKARNMADCMYNNPQTL